MRHLPHDLAITDIHTIHIQLIKHAVALEPLIRLVHPQRQNRVDGARREKYIVALHTEVFLLRIRLEPFAHFVWNGMQVHVHEFALGAVRVVAGPGAGVELFVVEDFEVGGEFFEVWVDCVRFVLADGRERKLGYGWGRTF
jgi:hypothetical protein